MYRFLLLAGLMAGLLGIGVVHPDYPDGLGIVVKIVGETASVQAAIDAGREVAERMQGKPVTNVINSADDEAWNPTPTESSR